MPIFFEAMDTLMGGRAPLKLWLRWYVIAPGEMDDLCSGIVTSGLAPFIGREIMAPPSEVEPRFMIEHAFEVARALLDDKRPLADAQVIDTEDGDKLRLKLRARVAGVEGPVCEITLPDPVARKRRAPVAPVQAADLLAAEEVGVRPPRSMQVNAAAAQAALGGPAASGASHQPSGAQNGAALPVQRTPPAAAPGSAPAAAPQPATEPYLLTDPVFVPDLPAGAPRAPAPSPETMPVLAPLNRDAGYSYAPPAAGPTREVASHDPAQHAQDPAAGGAAVPPDMGQPEWRPAAAPRPGGYDPLDPLGILPPQAPGRAAGGSPATGGVQAYDPVRARMALGYDPLDPMGYAAYRPGGQQGGSGSAGGSAGALGGPSRPAPDDTLLPPPRNPHAELFPEEPEEGERPELDRSRIRGISADWNGGAPPSRGDILGPDDSETRTFGERRIRVIPGGKSGR
jgi:hypothetical protein